jgi:hypothetical protein
MTLALMANLPELQSLNALFIVEAENVRIYLIYQLQTVQDEMAIYSALQINNMEKRSICNTNHDFCLLILLVINNPLDIFKDSLNKQRTRSKVCSFSYFHRYTKTNIHKKSWIKTDDPCVRKDKTQLCHCDRFSICLTKYNKK